MDEPVREDAEIAAVLPRRSGSLGSLLSLGSLRKKLTEVVDVLHQERTDIGEVLVHHDPQPGLHSLEEHEHPDHHQDLGETEHRLQVLRLRVQLGAEHGDLGVQMVHVAVEVDLEIVHLSGHLRHDTTRDRPGVVVDVSRLAGDLVLDVALHLLHVSLDVKREDLQVRHYRVGLPWMLLVLYIVSSEMGVCMHHDVEGLSKT